MNRRFFVASLTALALGVNAGRASDLYKGIGGDFVGSDFTRPKVVSYKLPDLMPTKLEPFKGTLTINYYISSGSGSEVFRAEMKDIKSRVGSFFGAYDVRSRFVESKSRLKKYSQPDNVGIEFLASADELADRVKEMIERPLDPDKHDAFYVGAKRVALIRPGKRFVKRVDSPKEYNDNVSMLIANRVAHELLHALSLLHYNVFEERDIVPEISGRRIPNIMNGARLIENNGEPGQKFIFDNSSLSLGQGLEDAQVAQMHSFLRGGNPFLAFKESNYDIGRFVQQTAKVNGLTIRAASMNQE